MVAEALEELEISNLVVLSDEEKEHFIDACFSFYKSANADGMLRFKAAKSFFDIVDYISEHYTEPSCTVTAICENLYISKSTLCRRFRHYFQTTPSDYIEANRFAEAKKLLLTGQSVQNACLNSGFSDCSYFIMLFRKKFGMTPYKYQREFM